MKSKQKINPDTVALPLIIKPWHKAIVRWDFSFNSYVCLFEGIGYKKLLFTISNPYNEALIKEKLFKLGFSQYQIKSKGSRIFKYFTTKDSLANLDGFINWELKYSKVQSFSI